MKRRTSSPPPVTIIEGLRAEARAIEELLDQSFVADQPPSLRHRRGTILDELERLEAWGDGGPLLTVQLDAYASAIVRRVLQDGPTATVADVVNACLVFSHGEADDHSWEGEQGELAAAMERRQQAQGGKGAR